MSLHRVTASCAAKAMRFGCAPCAVFSLIAAAGAPAQVPLVCESDPAWQERVGGTRDSWANDVLLLASGEVVVTGFFEGEAEFGAGQACSTTLTSASADIFLASYDAAGHLRWATSAGGLDNDWANAVCSATDGALLVVGEHGPDAVFGRGGPTETTLSGGGAFIALYDCTGALVWVRPIEAGSCRDVAMMSNGDAAVCGTRLGKMFVARYGAAASPVWIAEATEPGFSDAWGGLALFADESVAVTGYLYAPDHSISMFLARYGTIGQLLWWRTLVSTGDDLDMAFGTGVAVSEDQAVFLTGYFMQSMTLGSGETTETTLVATKDDDILLARYNQDGSFCWARKAGAVFNEFEGGSDQAWAVADLPADGVAITGYFHGDAVFGAGESNETVLSASGTTDMFFAVYGDDGTLACARGIDFGGHELGTSIAVSPDGSVALAGWFFEEPAPTTRLRALQPLEASPQRIAVSLFTGPPQPTGTNDFDLYR